MATPDIAVSNVLASAIGALTSGTNLYEGPELAVDAEIPAACVFVLSTSGPGPDRMFGTNAIYYPEVQIITRGAVNTRAATLVLARSYGAAIQANIPSGYVRADLLQSEPVYIGENGEDQPRFSQNVRLWIDQA